MKIHGFKSMRASTSRRYIIILMLISLSASLFSPSVLHSAPHPATDFVYSLADNKVTITDYVGTSQTVEIPNTLDGLPVVAIGQGAFAENELTSVSFPDSLTEIGAYAFQHNQLTSI